MGQKTNETPAEDLTDMIFIGAQEDDEYAVDPSASRGDTPAVAEHPTDPEPVAEPEPAPEPEPEPVSEPEPQAATGDAAPEPESDPSAPSEVKPKPEPRIPKSRFDEVNERRKKAEARLAELERERKAKAQVEEQAYDFEAREKDYAEALLDGNVDKALEIRREINAALEQRFETRSQRTADEVTDQKVQQRELLATVADLQARYPQFDNEGDAFNAEATNEALAMYEGYLATGKYSPAAAMQKAVGNVARLYDFRALDEEAPEPEAAPAPRAEATPQQRQQKLEAAAKQPPAPNTRQEAPRIDLASMSEDEFEKLSEAELRKLRGDFV